MAPGESPVMLRLPAHPSSVADARHAVMDACHSLPAETASDAALLVTEIVTNAVMHARGTIITVAIDCDEDRVAVAVGDHCTDPPVVCDLGVNDQHGRGMRLVDALAFRWGCTPSSDGEGKTVWFSLPS